MAVMNLPPGMMPPGGPQGPAMAGAQLPPGAMPQPPSILMPRQTGFPVRQHLRIPKPGRPKMSGKMHPATVKAVKAKAKRVLGGF